MPARLVVGATCVPWPMNLMQGRRDALARHPDATARSVRRGVLDEALGLVPTHLGEVLLDLDRDLEAHLGADPAELDAPDGVAVDRGPERDHQRADAVAPAILVDRELGVEAALAHALGRAAAALEQVLEGALALDLEQDLGEAPLHPERVPGGRQDLLLEQIEVGGLEAHLQLVAAKPPGLDQPLHVLDHARDRCALYAARHPHSSPLWMRSRSAHRRQPLNGRSCCGQGNGGWWRWADSNRRHAAYETAALTN